MERVLAIAAHPDDIELLMAGTMIRLQNAGFELHYFTVANGCCGSMTEDRDTTARIRRAEAEAAAAALGATYYPPVANDLEIFYQKDLLAKVASVIRAAAPRIVLTHGLSDYMEDHMHTARLAVTGAFVRGMPNFQTDPPRDAVPGDVRIYHAQPYFNRDPMGQLVKPHLFVDVADLEDRKEELLSKHASQKEWLDETQGQGCYLETMRSLDREVGRMSGRFEAAEGWRRHLHVGFCDPLEDPLRIALEPYVLVAEA